MIYTNRLTSKGQRKNDMMIKTVVDFMALKGTVKSKRKYSDLKADKVNEKHVAKEYGKKSQTL